MQPRKPRWIVLLGLSVIFLTPAPVGGATGDNGFTWLGRNDAVYVSARDGRAMKLVARVPRADFGWDRVDDLAWARTGRRLAYTTCASAACYVHVFTKATAKTTTLKAPTGNASEPAWAPDEERLAFYNFPDNSRKGGYISIVSLGSNRMRVLVAPQALRRDQQPAWSPDGRTIAFVRERLPISERDAFPPAVIHLVDATGRSSRRLTVGRSPDWSPDGSRIVFADQGTVYVIRADGRDRRRLVPVARNANLDPSPKWSPDGTTVLYAVGRDRIAWTVDVATGRRTRVVQVTGFSGPVAWAPSGR